MRLALLNIWLARISVPILVLGHLLLAILARYRMFADNFLLWGFADSILLVQGFLVICCAQLSPLRWWTRCAVTAMGIVGLIVVHNPSPLSIRLFLTAMVLATVALAMLRSLRFALSPAEDGSSPVQFSIRATLLGITLVAVYFLNLQQARIGFLEFEDRKRVGILFLGTNFAILSLATIWTILSQKSPWGRMTLLASLALLVGLGFPFVIDRAPRSLDDLAYLFAREKVTNTSTFADEEYPLPDFGSFQLPSPDLSSENLFNESQWRWQETGTYVGWNLALVSQLALSLVLLRNSGLRIVQSNS